MAQFASTAGVEQMKSDLEDRSMELASQLATERQHQQNVETGVPIDVAAKGLNLARTKAQLASLGITIDDDGNVNRSAQSGSAGNITAPAAPANPANPSAAVPAGNKNDQVVIAGNGKLPTITASMLPPGMSMETARWLALNAPDQLGSVIAKSREPIQVREHSSVTGFDENTGTYKELYKNYGTATPLTDADRQKFGLKPADAGFIDENGNPHLLKDQSTAAPSVDRDVLLPIMQKLQRGETLTAGEQQVIATMKPGAAPAAGDESVTAVSHAIANYQQPQLTGFVQKTPWGQQVMAQVYKENPDYRAEEYNAANRAQSAFAVGPQGNQVRSVSVAISHLGTLQDLGNALNNGDVQIVNRAKQFFEQQFGQAAPANFDAVKQIVGQEITKAVISTGGGVTERQEAAQALSRANSPAQLQGVIDSYKRLLAGQLDGLRRQYETQTKAKNFEDMLSPEAKQELESLPESTGNGRGQAAPSIPTRPASVPAGSAYSPSRKIWRTPDGKFFDDAGKAVQ